MTKALKEYNYAANPHFVSLILDINENYAPWGWRVISIIVDSGYYFAALERNKDGE